MARILFAVLFLSGQTFSVNICSDKYHDEYIYVEEEMSWHNAQRFCRENFNDMATVRSSTENQMAMTLVPADNCSWIGLFNGGRFYWSDGSSVVFENWDNGYNPIGSMTVVCGVTSIDNSGKFNFFSCETKLPFVFSTVPPIRFSPLFLDKRKNSGAVAKLTIETA
uniref:C-type lectin domain-containing protein n=1 Tax=Fundulus heteroclitus TaxID=8078 RepID=A0A3Q2QYX8_FUNHE